MIQKLSPQEYHAIGRTGPMSEWVLSKSFLFDFARSPYAWKYRHDRGIRKEPSDAMDWGSAVDSLATNSEEFTATVQFVDAASWLGKAAQEARQAIRAAGKVALLEKDREAVQEAGRMLAEHFRRHGLDAAATQVCATSTWQAPSGRSYVLKCLADFFEPLADLKTTRDLDARSLAGTIRDFGYHWQAAFYLDCFRANAIGLPEEFPLHFQEKAEPYRTRVWHLTPEDIAKGRAEYVAALELWDFCVSSDKWEGKELPEISGRNATYQGKD